MEKLKFVAGSIIVLGFLGLLGSWAVATMQSGSEYVNKQKIQALEQENKKLKEEGERLKGELALLQRTNPKPIAEAPEKPKEEKPAEPAKKPATTTYKNQTLINELQSLVNKGVVLEPKSVGPSVGTVQKFLNVYNKTSKKIDNDYGESTKSAVMAFQKAEGLTADGGAGKATFTKMIAWLKKQG